MFAASQKYTTYTVCTHKASDCLHLRLVFVVCIQEKPSQAIIVIVEGNLDLNILADQIQGSAWIGLLATAQPHR